MRILCCLTRSPVSFSRRFPGGTRRGIPRTEARRRPAARSLTVRPTPAQDGAGEPALGLGWPPALFLLMLAGIGGLLGYVWLTRYRYHMLSTGGDTYPVRINCFTGNADALVPGEGWAPVEELWLDEENPPDGSAS
jgi:hypothetical protein